MKAATRAILTLPGQSKVENAAEDRPFPVAVYDLLLPCRRFRIAHKVAVLGRVSLTAEFLLRLLRSLDTVDEQDVARFFGFNRRELAFVLAEVEEHGFAERSNGRLFLTSEGHSLFRDGSPHPEIFDVEKKEENFGFDLVSLAPQQMLSLERFERGLPELPSLDAGQLSSAASRIDRSFSRHFSELVGRRDVSASKRSLYSIDAVTPSDRFLTPVRVTTVSAGMRSPHVDIDLGEWRPLNEQEDRLEVRKAASVFIDGLARSKRPDDGDAYRILTDLAPEFLKEFTRRDGLAVERYLNEASIRAGEPRSDRPTIPVLGSLLLHDNLRRTIEVLKYGLRSGRRPATIIWSAPQVPYWGATSLLPSLLRQIIPALGHSISDRGGPVERTVCIVAGRDGRYLEEAFGRVCRVDAPALPRSLEVLLVPGVLAAAMVHAPIGTANGPDIPLGFVSFDPQVLGRVADLLAARYGRSLPPDLLEELAVDPAN